MSVRGTKAPRIILAALLIGAAVGIILVNRIRQPHSWQLMPDETGKLQHVVCVVNSARRAMLRNAQTVTRIVNALPLRVRVTILTNDRQAFIVARNPHPERVSFLDLPAESAFTIWPQDPFLVLEDEQGGRKLLISNEFQRLDDRLIPEQLAAHFDLPSSRSELSFEGGNIVSGSRHVFIGAETVRYNAIKLDESDDVIVRCFERELGRDVIVIGPIPQPVGHIDMVLTVIDEKTLALADTGWGARLAREQLDESPAKVEAFEKACETNYFGHPDIRFLRDKDAKPIHPPQIVGKTIQAIEFSETMAAELDRIAEGLAEHGYKVQRIPQLYWPSQAESPDEDDQPTTATAPTDKPEAAKPGYPHLTYNNVLLERWSDRRVVYLPQYGWEALDKAAHEAWQRIGFEIVPVEGLTISAMYGGSLRCCVKVLQRRP